MKWDIVRRQDSVFTDSRVTIGKKEGSRPYLIFSGTPHEVIKLMEEALADTKQAIINGTYLDRRNE